MRVQRLLDRPIISADLHPSIGLNIQGPSMIRAPDWIDSRLGNYYLYFADQKGSYIRLAYADDPLGPWRIHPPGSLQLEQSCFLTKPPTVTPEQLAQFETRLKQAGVVISHDLLSEITTPHIASPDVHVDAPERRIVMYSTASKPLEPRSRAWPRHRTASTSTRSPRYSDAPTCAPFSTMA